MNTIVLADCKNKRIVAFDYGDARIGVAVCDEMHIIVSTRPVITNNPDTVWDEIQRRIADDRIDVVLVGMPVLDDNRITPIMERITEFVSQLATIVSIPIGIIDESFSTKRAFEAMRNAGNSRKRRQEKGRKDQVAAAVMLRDFIEGQL